MNDFWEEHGAWLNLLWRGCGQTSEFRLVRTPVTTILILCYKGHSHTKLLMYIDYLPYCSDKSIMNFLKKVLLGKEKYVFRVCYPINAMVNGKSNDTAKVSNSLLDLNCQTKWTEINLTHAFGPDDILACIYLCMKPC